MGNAHKSLQEWDTEIGRRVGELSLCRYARNMAVPVNARLPPEILYQIFLGYQAEACASLQGRQYTWLYIAHVCRYWRELVLEAPHFWRRIFLSELTRLDCVEEMLRRSAGAFLIINVRFTGLRVAAPRTLEVVLQYLPRIQTLCIRSCPDLFPSINVNLVKSHAHQLSSLTLAPANEYSRGWSNVPIPALPCIPKLTTLELLHSSTRISHCQHLFTSTLKALVIRVYEIPRQGELQSALSRLPHLESLHLITPLTNRPKSVFVKRPISMPRLRAVKFVGSTWTCAYFLNSLSLPINATIDVEVCPGPEELSRSDTMDYGVLGSALRGKLYEETKDRISPLVSLGIHTASERVILSWWRIPDLSCLTSYHMRGKKATLTMRSATRQLETFFTTHDMTDIRVLAIGSLDYILGQAWTGALSQLKNVEIISIVDDLPTFPPALSNVLEYRVAQEAPTLLFPKLQTIYLSSVEILPGENRVAYRGMPAYRNGVPTRRAILEWQSFVTSLRIRAGNDMPITSVIFSDVDGLLPGSIAELKGLVKSVRLNERYVEFDVPIMSGPEVLERYGINNEESDAEAPREHNLPFIIAADITEDEDDDDDGEDEDEFGFLYLDL